MFNKLKSGPDYHSTESTLPFGVMLPGGDKNNAPTYAKPGAKILDLTHDKEFLEMTELFLDQISKTPGPVGMSEIKKWSEETMKNDKETPEGQQDRTDKNAIYYQNTNKRWGDFRTTDTTHYPHSSKDKMWYKSSKWSNEHSSQHKKK